MVDPSIKVHGTPYVHARCYASVFISSCRSRGIVWARHFSGLGPCVAEAAGALHLPCADPGYSSPMRADQHELPTPRTTLGARYVRVLVWC
jgi:hypothetical protein